MEIQQKDNETLVGYGHHFKTAAKQYTFDSDNVAICIFVEGFGLCMPLQLGFMKRTLKLWSHQNSWKIQCSTTANSHADTLHGQYDL